MTTDIINNTLILHIEKDIYNEDVLHKCFYWYGANYSIDISGFSEKLFEVKMRPLNELHAWEEIIEKIKRDLVDFKLRDIVSKETKTIRELIVAKAFAYYGMNDNPLTEVTDPVGFDPLEINKHG